MRSVSCTIFIGFSVQYRDANCNCRVVKYIQYTIHYWPGSSSVHRGLGNALVLKHLISRRRKGIKDHWGIFLLATSGNLQRRIFPIARKTFPVCHVQLIFIWLAIAFAHILQCLFWFFFKLEETTGTPLVEGCESCESMRTLNTFVGTLYRLSILTAYLIQASSRY